MPSYYGPLGTLIGDVADQHRTLSLALSALIVFASALAIARITTQRLLFGVRTYLPFIAYVMFACGVALPSAPLIPLSAAFLIIRGTEKYIRGFTRQPNYDLCFRGSGLIGMAGLVWLPAFWFMLMTPAAMMLFRRDSREAVISLLGVTLPVVTACYLTLLAGGGFFDPVRDAVSLVNFGAVDIGAIIALGYLRLGFIAVTAVIVLLSVVYMLRHRSVRFRQRRIFAYFLSFVPVCAFVSLCCVAEWGMFPFWAATVSVVLPLWPTASPGKSRNILMGLWVLLAVAANALPLAGVVI